MNMNRFTMKSLEAVQQAGAKALHDGHEEIDVEHVLFALLGQQDGLCYAKNKTN